MNLVRKTIVILIVMIFALGVSASTPLQQDRHFDDFGDINCEDEMARLDNFAIQLQREPNAKGLIVFYGGRRFRGRLPKRGEAAARAARLKPYLVQRRGVPADQVIVADGGYDEVWHAMLWIVPAGVSLPTPNSIVPASQIKFGRGKARARDFRCQI
jgi:hypothetical protein